MKYILHSVLIAIFIFSSCGELEDEVLPILGIYKAKINSNNRFFLLTVYGDRDDDVVIQAPFGGEVISEVNVDIDNIHDFKWELDINRQTLSPGIEIWGEGLFIDRTIQLDYTISIGGDKYKYRIIASR
jgi:hypothetical protein